MAAFSGAGDGLVTAVITAWSAASCAEQPATVKRMNAANKMNKMCFTGDPIAVLVNALTVYSQQAISARLTESSDNLVNGVGGGGIRDSSASFTASTIYAMIDVSGARPPPLSWILLLHDRLTGRFFHNRTGGYLMSAQEVIYLTKEGYEDLENQLENLITVRRPEIANRLRLALDEGGELIENTEYANAKQEQSMLEGDIERLKTLLSQAQIIEDDSKSRKDGMVHLNSVVTLKDEESDEVLTYHIVGRVEANPREGKISDESPLGKALIGKKSGDKVSVNAPDGVFVYKIKSVK